MTRNRNRVLSILISVMLIMSMVFSCVPMANAASTDVQSSGGQEIGIYGDVDLNGEVNIRDVTRKTGTTLCLILFLVYSSVRFVLSVT